MIADPFRHCGNAACLVLLVYLAGTTPTSAQYVTLDEAIAAVEKNYEAYRSLPGLYVSYTSTYRHVRGARFFGDLTFDIVNARRGDNMYVAFHDQEGVLNEYTWNKAIGMYRARKSVEITPYMRSQALTIQNYIDLLFYPEASFHYEKQFGPKMINPKIYHGEDYWLPAALSANRESYRTLPGEQTVEGAACRVLERPGVDRIWLDAARGFVILRRDFWYPGGKLLRERTILRDHVEAAPGLWLPHRMEHQIYCGPEDPWELWNQVAGVRTVEVKELEVKPLPDEQFVLSIDEGASVNDAVRKVVYQNFKPGEDPVREAERAVRRLAGNAGSTGRVGWWIAALVFVGAGIAILAYWVRRRNRALSGN